ncbi:MAG: urea transporter, partial [Bacteroidota bacterium]|nr:urea transporter [Bacteroidota bacterium]
MVSKLKAVFPQFIESVLHSYSLVFFGKNNLLAIILLCVTFLDIYTGAAGLFATVVTSIVAYLIGLNSKKIISGNYGFNSLLVGLGLGIQFQPSIELYIILVFAALLTLLLTVSIEGLFLKYGIPFLTFPFLIAIWIITLATRQYEALQISERGIYILNDFQRWGGSFFVEIYQWFVTLPLGETIVIYLKSLGAIFFQYNILAGLIICIGLLIYSRISFLLSLIGFFSAYYFYQFIGANIDELNYNYIGFNFILTSIAMGGFLIIPSKYSFLWVVLLTPIISLIISSSTVILNIFQLPVYSLSFNIVVAMFLYALMWRYRSFNKPAITGIQLFKPELNLYYQKNSAERFFQNKYLAISLPILGEWTISQGHNGEHTHKEEWQYALDLIITDNNKQQFKTTGDTKEDYYCYNKPVVAPAPGTIIKVVNNIEDNFIGDVDIQNNWGNTIIIKHLDGLYSKMSHLKKESVQVNIGDYVNKGDIIGYSGNSGRSPYPHLHFQMQSTPYIGSKTLFYPIANFITVKEKKHSLSLYAIPKKDDIISNININENLKTAFQFVPGQMFTVDITKSNGKKTDYNWEVQTDINNNIYIYCKETKSKAYFLNNNNIHYFTHFTGDKNSVLFYFYIAMFKVPLGYYKEMKISDSLPLSILKNSPQKILQ